MNASSTVLASPGVGTPGRHRNTSQGRLLVMQGAELGQRGREGGQVGEDVKPAGLPDGLC